MDLGYWFYLMQGNRVLEHCICIKVFGDQFHLSAWNHGKPLESEDLR